MHEKQRIPQTLGRLRAWIRDTEAGREILREATSGLLEQKCRECQEATRRRPRVLVVARRLGRYAGVEVYAERGVTVRLEELIESHDDPAIERLLDDLLHWQLPKSWRPVLMRVPDRLAFMGVTADQRLETLENAAMFRDWRNILREAFGDRKRET